jgi:hypothetical protein
MLSKKAIESAHRAVAENNVLASGSDGRILYVTRNVYLKLMWGSEHEIFPADQFKDDNEPQLSARENTILEFERRNEIYNPKIRIPKYHQLFETEEGEHGILMQRIFGLPVRELNEKQREEAFRQYDQQCELIEQCGYRVIPSTPYVNTLFNTQRGRLFLLDLMDWEKIN